jgi:hypothetical protein
VVDAGSAAGLLTYERARDVARSLAHTEAFEQSRRDPKCVEMRFAHLKRILRRGRLRPTSCNTIGPKRTFPQAHPPTKSRIEFALVINL